MINQRIRQARMISGFSQDEVVQALIGRGMVLTKAALSKYERGTSTPRASLLKHLGAVLNVPAEYFLRETEVSIEWLAFRKRADVSTRDQERFQAMAVERVEAYVQLRDSLSIDPPPPFPLRMTVGTPEEAEGAAEQLRKDWNLDDLPIESMAELIEDHEGIVVQLEGSETSVDGLAGVANKSHAVVVVDPSVSDDRKRFTLAHELGHLVMNTESVTDTKQQERLAHRFASAFLVPAGIARKELGSKRTRLSFEELKILKVKYGLSMQAWIFRAHDSGIIDEQHFRSLFDQMSRMGMRKVEPVQYKGREEPQRFKQMILRALAEGIMDQKQAFLMCPELEESFLPTVSPRLTIAGLRNLSKEDRDALLANVAANMADVYGTDPELKDLEDYDDITEGEPS